MGDAVYGKIFASMFDGTLALGPWQAIVALQQLIILADADGDVDMTVEALSRRTTIPVEVLRVGIEHLAKPDPNSRTSDMEGRRIIPIDEARPWGWHIVNYAKYREIRSHEDRRAYMRKHMREKRAKPANAANNSKLLAPAANSKLELAMLADAEVYSEEENIYTHAGAGAGAREAGEPEPDEVDTKRTPELFRRGFERRFLKATGSTPSWGPENVRKAAEVAKWVDAQPDSVSVLERLLDGFFADKWVSDQRWPIGALARNPARYLPVKRQSGSGDSVKVGDWSDVLGREIECSDDVIRHLRKDPKWERPTG